jgi:hypothetical protein
MITLMFGKIQKVTMFIECVGGSSDPPFFINKTIKEKKVTNV